MLKVTSKCGQQHAQAKKHETAHKMDRIVDVILDGDIDRGEKVAERCSPIERKRMWNAQYERRCARIPHKIAVVRVDHCGYYE